MKTLKNLLIIAAAAIATCFTACNNDSTIGSSIVQDKIAIVIDSAYTLDGRVVETTQCSRAPYRNSSVASTQKDTAGSNPTS